MEKGWFFFNIFGPCDLDLKARYDFVSVHGIFLVKAPKTAASPLELTSASKAAE
jgi:hypothetical protein